MNITPHPEWRNGYMVETITTDAASELESTTTVYVRPLEAEMSTELQDFAILADTLVAGNGGAKDRPVEGAWHDPMPDSSSHDTLKSTRPTAAEHDTKVFQGAKELGYA
jgi:hypothetical protein